MGDFVFKSKSPNGRELEIQIPIPGTRDLDTLKNIINPKKEEDENTSLVKKNKKRQKIKDGESRGALASMSALLASLIMIAMDD